MSFFSGKKLARGEKPIPSSTLFVRSKRPVGLSISDVAPFFPLCPPWLLPYASPLLHVRCILAYRVYIHARARGVCFLPCPLGSTIHTTRAGLRRLVHIPIHTSLVDIYVYYIYTHTGKPMELWPGRYRDSSEKLCTWKRNKVWIMCIYLLHVSARKVLFFAAIDARLHCKSSWWWAMCVCVSFLWAFVEIVYSKRRK